MISSALREPRLRAMLRIQYCRKHDRAWNAFGRQVRVAGPAPDFPHPESDLSSVDWLSPTADFSDAEAGQGSPLVSGAPVGGTGSVAGTNCTICVANPTDGTPMLPTGKYVVEVVVPPGYELVKEEDKNILIGDNYIAPVTQEFGALGSIFILPDQATIAE